MNKAAFQAVAEVAFRDLPVELLCHVENVVFLVEDWPDEETLEEMDIADPEELLGLYHGSPLSMRSVDTSGQLPDRIILYQKPIELHAAEYGIPVRRVVRETLIHEIGHHFGLDEEELLHLEGGGAEHRDRR